MNIGFTGTQQGITAAQERGILAIFESYPDALAFYHGDCIGADAEAHQLWVDQTNKPVHIYPCGVSGKRAFCQSAWVAAEMPPLERNRHIVDRIDVLIACPKEDNEVIRSGTWATVRYAKKKNKLIYIIYPQGKVETINLFEWY